MLTEEEWQRISPLLSNVIRDFKRHREEHGATVSEANALGGLGAEVLAAYREITGFEESNVNAIYHHRLSIYGPLCEGCGKPLRTPQARCCAACGLPRPLRQYDVQNNTFAP